MRRVLGVVAILAGIAAALMGGFAALTVWVVMAAYPDDVPNTLLQNLSPLLLLVPAISASAVLFWIGWKAWRRPDPS